jgi:bifunctional UDP-N-acetylglucosamine pyrophosphorylase/glucosamine-1-phosphate N-acetyltransferase
MAEDLLKGWTGPVIVAPGDAPLIDSSIYAGLLETHGASGAACTVLTAEVPDATGFGRLVRNAAGEPTKIVEHKDATPDELQIREVNTAVYCFDGPTLFRLLPLLRNDNRQGEYYLTDLIAAISNEGLKVSALVTDDSGALVGVNDRWQLAQADAELTKRILKKHALNGVTLIGYESVRIEPDVELESDCVLEGPVQLCGKTRIGARSKIGPGTRISDSTVGQDTTVLSSFIDRSKIGNDVWIGPFANIRPFSEIGDHCKIGNFVETKNSRLERDVKVSHLSYVGDAAIGENTNVGAGTITVNYDGFGKFRTTIGANAFVGSNSTLIAPLNIGDGAFVVAGSVVTDDVPSDAGVFGRARQVTKEAWALEFRRRKQSNNP